ncbi:MAG: PGPGW domain-containing protein [Verrucomicrobiae bacterium]|nr:PGPGW domain-containing protein [Verrucomicrobiae bacterium]MDW8344267.1 PGPGW domain-containing protein [Verrucomicrobiae bacterium]
MTNCVLQHGQRIVRISVGVALSLVGSALLVLPGPGIPLILIGLTILAADFVWARRLKRRLGREAIRATRRWRRNRQKPPPINPPTPPAA